MIAPNWEDLEAKTNPIINYFADRQHTEIIIKKIKMTIIKTCFYCKNCENCTKLSEKHYRKIFNEQGFWTFNKHIRCWNVFDPEWSYKNKFFELFPIKEVRNRR